jgi:hypothetical protein
MEFHTCVESLSDLRHLTRTFSTPDCLILEKVGIFFPQVIVTLAFALCSGLVFYVINYGEFHFPLIKLRMYTRAHELRLPTYKKAQFVSVLGIIRLVQHESTERETCPKPRTEP